ncbi:MAG: MacB family efflux pump subunit [Spirochaetes bacterium RBG_16_49_21]|nr:MAG: MacB family efflux pump subunit [Spirochaetes bacterium RBG_16_49_21]
MIELKNVSKIYDTGTVQVRALSDVSLSIEEGEFVAVMGHSGSGKSTLLNILGFLDKPDEGTYLLMGRDITELGDDELSLLRNHIAGFVFQQFNLLPRMNSLENVGLPLVYAGKRDFKDTAREKIRQVMLARRERHYPNELSGGEQQRVAIARAIVNRPLIVFADEPTGNLDTKSEEEIISVLEDLNREGITIIMVTHEQEIAAHAKRIIRMRDGRIISDEKLVRKKRPLSGRGRSINEILSNRHSYFGTAEFVDYLKQAMESIVSHKLRSILSMLGILIGVAAVIAMLALGEGAKESITRSLSSLGSNLLTIRSGSHRQMGVALETGLVTRLTLQDARELSRLSEVRRISASVVGRGQVVYNNRNWNTQIWGTGAEYAYMKAAVPLQGRFFTDDELRSRKKVAVVGATIIKELFGSTNPVGRTFKINRINFKIIGVLPVKGVTFFRDQDDAAVIPVTTAMYRLLGKEYVDFIDVEITNQALIDQAILSIRKLIIKRHRLLPDDEDSFEIRDMSEIRDLMTSTTKTMSLLLGIVASISLFVGGIGIMNIMLVSVKERIKEIGLRKAIGARRKDILLQFLIESSLLTFSGGIVGIILGCGVSILISLMAQWSIKISPSAVLISSLFSILIGIGFGFWPAVQASRLNPIEALRYE